MSELLLELRRQVVHMCLGVGIAVSAYSFREALGWLVLLPIVAAIAGLVAVQRLRALEKLKRALLRFERKEDAERFPFKGAIYYVIGIVPALLFCELDEACGIVMVLSIGDALATLVGKPFGRLRIGKRSLEGFLAFVIGAFLASMFFLPPPRAGMLSLVGGVVELLSPIDDNLLIPLSLTLLCLIS